MKWCDRIGSGIFKVFYFIGKFLGLVALDYDFKKKIFLTSNGATFMSIVICIFVAVVSPIIVKWNTDIHYTSGVYIDENMSLIVAAQFGMGFATSFIVLLCQLWKRKHVSRSANDFQKVFNQLSTEMGCGNIITPEIICLIAMKFSITMYEVLINFPFLIEYGYLISSKQFVSFFLNLYIAEIAVVFSDITFAALLLFARYFYLVDELLKSLKMEIPAGSGLAQKHIHDHEYKRKLFRLIRLYLRMKQMFGELIGCVELSIFVQLLNSSANMLTNLYALLDFFASEKYLQITPLVYNVMIFVNICLVIYAAERVKQSSMALMDSLLDLDAIKPHNRSDGLVFKVWPEVFEVNILGMFPLNNTFLLFLISYVSNFVVIILQFQLDKML